MFDMRDHIAERTELAHTYACDGAYFSAGRILFELAIEVLTHGCTVSPVPELPPLVPEAALAIWEALRP